MGVSHRCCNARVPQQFFDRGQWHASHCQVRRKRVSKGMPANFPHVSLFAQPSHCCAESIICEWPTVVGQEHISTLSLTSLEHCAHVIIERYVSRPTILW